MTRPIRNADFLAPQEPVRLDDARNPERAASRVGRIIVGGVIAITMLATTLLPGHHPGDDPPHIECTQVTSGGDVQLGCR